MMRKENVDAFALQRPLQPFEIRRVDGERFRIRCVGQFVVRRYNIVVRNPKSVIATIRPLLPRRRRA